MLLHSHSIVHTLLYILHNVKYNYWIIQPYLNFEVLNRLIVNLYALIEIKNSKIK